MGVGASATQFLPATRSLAGRGTIEPRSMVEGSAQAAQTTPPPCSAWFPSPSRRDVEELPPERAQHMLDPNELLARAAGPRASRFGFLDLAPVVIVGGHHAAAFEQRLQARGPAPLARASRRHRGGYLVGDLIAIGAVGADRPARSPSCPADGIEALVDLALVIEEFAAALVVGDAVERRRRVADAA